MSTYQYFVCSSSGTTSTTLASIRAAASGLARDALSAALGTQRLSSGSSMQESAAAAWPLGYASDQWSSLKVLHLSITSPGSHVPQHRWAQHHVSRLALMLALMCLAVAIHSLSHIHDLRMQA